MDSGHGLHATATGSGTGSGGPGASVARRLPTLPRRKLLCGIIMMADVDNAAPLVTSRGPLGGNFNLSWAVSYYSLRLVVWMPCASCTGKRLWSGYYLAS